MDDKSYKRAIFAGGTTLLVVALVAGLLTVVGYFSKSSGSGSPDPKASASITVAVADCRVMAAHYVQMSKGFTPDQYVIGKIDAKLPGVTANRGDSFSDKPVYTKEELRKQLNANTTQSVMVITSVQDQIKGSIKPRVTEVQNVDNWVSVQYKVPVFWPENTTFVGGNEKPVGVLDNGLIGEVSWVYVSQIGCDAAKAGSATKTPEQVKKIVEQTASKRGACLNGNDHPRPKPKPPTTPPSTPTPCESQTATPCPKDADAIPDEPSTPASAKPSPIGTVGNPTRPASSDPTPSNGNPVHDVNPPTESAVPDSGSGAGGATANAPSMSQTPEPAPSATNTVIVGSD